MADNLVVAKYGSETVADNKGIIQAHLDRYAEQLVKVSHNLIVVSSGAVKIGRAEAPHIDDDQQAAALGSAGVVIGWKKAFERVDRLASQVLVTDREIDDIGEEGSRFRRGITHSLDQGIVPIINTNDFLNPEELEKRPWKGENDGPASHMAYALGADVLLLLTDLNGVFDNAGRPIAEVPYGARVHRKIKEMVADRGLAGQGIMAKVEAATAATDVAIDAYIAGASEDISDILAHRTGTHFVARP